ncbi:hypothetical protein KO02_21620 [Sphingobacterium sp. ML3W]|uniref:hypothetical protein n=1 Tax=Sphingobacterium sp. ML3W TaxID=1538644 RepID=UPI0004F5F39A|nr:hypothetical protein [Sphingobacterium sp. ML3W]AIM39002.1 hypothetical protein KO02_21620 [Sphingobacterium sp. ML3W]
MIKSILVLYFAFSGLCSFAQSTTRVEVSPKELMPKAAGFFSEVSAGNIQQMLAKNLTIYSFDVIYNGQVIAREGIKKPIEGSGDGLSAMSRLTYELFFPYTAFETEDLLSLLEDKLVETKKVGDMKYLKTADFALVDQDINGGFKVANPLGDKVIIKLYKETLN